MRAFVFITFALNFLFFLFGLYAVWDTANAWAGGRSDYLGLAVAAFLVLVCGSSALAIRHLSRRH